MITLYDYHNSTASYRVRIALNLKGIDFQLKQVHLVNDGGEHYQKAFVKLNPFSRVPVLDDNGVTLTQSLAIIDYLDNKYPNPPLLSQHNDPIDNAKIRAFALTIACDVHPLNNLSVLQYLKNTLNVSDDDKNQWYAHWITKAFQALEIELQEHAGTYCFGDHVSLADICLVGQVYNAHRFKVDITAYPIINRINQHCLTVDAFRRASPEETLKHYLME